LVLVTSLGGTVLGREHRLGRRLRQVQRTLGAMVTQGAHGPLRELPGDAGTLRLGRERVPDRLGLLRIHLRLVMVDAISHVPTDVAEQTVQVLLTALGSGLDAGATDRRDERLG